MSKAGSLQRLVSIFERVWGTSTGYFDDLHWQLLTAVSGTTIIVTMAASGWGSAGFVTRISMHQTYQDGKVLPSDVIPPDAAVVACFNNHYWPVRTLPVHAFLEGPRNKE